MVLLERDAFIGQLASLLASARHGRGRMALVVGEAGIGKTSLVDAFSATAEGPTRVLWGSCDPIVPARPFTPVVDIADRVGGDLRRALAAGDRDAVLNAFLGVLRRPDVPPTILVLDDLHWADEATLDLLEVVARRIGQMSTLLIGTYRDHEVAKDHPLRVALGDVPASVVTEIRLPALSPGAVGRLSGGRADAAELHRLTGGNPFFVTEMLAVAAEATRPGDRAVPTTVRDAVLTRLGRLTRGAQGTSRAAAVLGPGSAIRTVLELADEGRDALDEAVAHALLVTHDGAVSFRHELARRAVLDTLPSEDLALLHRRALDVLRAPAPVDWPRLARHAIAARDVSAILELAPQAGRASESLGANREAVRFYGAALEHGDRLTTPERADLLERHAHVCSLANDVPRALETQQEALALWRLAGDRRREGACLTALSGLLWLAGRGPDAMRTAETAAVLLEETAPGSPELARAWAVVAQRLLVGGGDERRTIDTASHAIALAERLGSEDVAVHALTSLGVARIFLDDASGWPMLEEAAARARAAGLVEDAVRALINLVEAARDLRRYDLADRYLAETNEYLEAHDLWLYEDILRSRVAALALEAGRWDEALADGELLLGRQSIANPVRVRALTIRGLVRARRAAGESWSDLDAALALAGDEPQDLLPLRAARAEAAWLDGEDARARDEASMGIALGDRTLSRWWWSELAFWGWLAGATEPLPHPDEQPYWLQATGRATDAAAAWAAIGAPYQQAFALAGSDAEGDLRLALRMFNRLGARAMGRRVTQKLLAIGATQVDRGPRAQTRANPAQLTARQLEILALLAEGLANSDIAGRLVISTKTVDHHVSAILRKLAVQNRRGAAAAARSLGLMGAASQDGEVAGAR